jgi:hypothetical protein
MVDDQKGVVRKGVHKLTIQTIKFSQFAAVNLATTTNKVVGTSSLSGGTNFYADFPQSWTTANRPSMPATGTLGYNTSLGQYEYWNGAAWTQLASGGSGSVNLGSVNQMAWYAGTGTAVSGLSTLANGVLVTSSGSVPSISTTLPAGLAIPQPIIGGVTDGSSAASGKVGQVITSIIPQGSAVSLTSGIVANITFIPLPAGDWDVWGNVLVFGGGTLVIQRAQGWMSTTSASEPDGSLQWIADFGSSGMTMFFDAVGSPVPSQPFSVSTTTNIYLSAKINSVSGSYSACGGLYARRRR